MAVITALLSQFPVQRLGWTLLHFLWQGTAIVVVHALLRIVLRRSLSAQGRYALACLALGAMALAPPLTFVLIPNAPETGSWTIPVAESRRLLPGVVALWLLGVLAFSIRLFGGWRFTARLRSTSHPAPSEWQQTLGRIAARAGTSLSGARLLASSLVDVPTVIGWLRPAILVPVESLTGLPGEYMTALLAHELAHIRRNDYLASILQSIAEAVLFYHPAVWWISGQIRAERESCCDDLAVASTGDVLTYARALTELESRRPACLKPSHLKHVPAANGGSLVNRIRRLIEPAQTTADSFPGPGAAWAMAMLWLAGVGLATIHAAPTPQPPSRVVNPGTAPASTPSVPALRSPFPALASSVRKTLLYDPFLSPQLAQPVADAAAPWRKWLEEEVVYIVTDNERRAFRQLNTDGEREEFVEQFWLRRDPTPGTVENEYREEHYRRIAYANEHYGWSGIPGWKTDRGRIYITYGPPNEIDSRPSSAAPTEDWTYLFINGVSNVRIEFVDGTTTGDYRMATSLAQTDTLAPQPGLKPQETPSVKFKDLEAAIGTRTTGNVLPMQVRIDYVRVTEASVIANITVQFENGNLQFQLTGGVEKAVVNLLGRISTMTRRSVATFEKPLEIDAPPELLRTYAQQRSLYQQSVPLAPGRYRLNLVAQDTVAGSLNNYEVVLDVPHFEEEKLASSSLILADTIEKLPARSIGGAMFSIGDTRVRPRFGNTFTHTEKMGIYLQVYNFRPDGATQKPSGSIEYEIDKAGSNEKIMDFSEAVAGIAYASASQVTIRKLLPLNTFVPGSYTLRVTVIDKNGNQTVRQQGNFSVSPE